MPVLVAVLMLVVVMLVRMPRLVVMAMLVRVCRPVCMVVTVLMLMRVAHKAFTTLAAAQAAP